LGIKVNGVVPSAYYTLIIHNKKNISIFFTNVHFSDFLAKNFFFDFDLF